MVPSRTVCTKEGQWDPPLCYVYLDLLNTEEIVSTDDSGNQFGGRKGPDL